jgi:hypothetical protein
MKLWIFALLSLITTPTFAQNVEPSPDALHTMTPTPQEPQLSLPKRVPERALHLSLRTTLAGGALVFAGYGVSQLVSDGPVATGTMLLGASMIAVGPSAGHFYNRGYGRGVVTALLRAGAPISGAMLGASIEIALDSNPDDIEEFGPGFSGLLIGGFIGIAASTALATYDIFDAPRAVRRGSSKIFPLRRSSSK